MKVVPRPLSAEPEKWAQFKGVRKIGINDLPIIFPGFDPIDEIRLTVSSAPYPGHMSFAELGIVVALVRAMRVTSFAQIGTFDGLTVRNILDNCPDLQNITTVDLPDSMHANKGAGTVYPSDAFNSSLFGYANIGSRYRGHPRAGIVRDVRKDSALLVPEDFAAAPEVFLIDGNHSYQYCASDTKIAHRVLKKPGFIIWHDYGQVEYLPGVTRALNELADTNAYSLYWLKGFPETTLAFGIQNLG
jgi:hypothetical protein